jgi:hypothetical protein
VRRLGVVLTRRELEHHQVIPYLIERGLIAPSMAVDGGVRVVSSARRNRNYHVSVVGGPSFLVKQGVRPGDGPGTVALEARVLAGLRALPAATGIGDRIPRTACFDADRGILTLALVAEAENLRVRHLRLGRISTRVAGSIGETLGLLHGVGDAAGAYPGFEALPVAIPDVFALTCPPVEVLHGTSAAAHAYIATVQRVAGLADPLDSLAAGYRKTTLIHGDPRWDNWLVVARKGRARLPVMLVDWEFSARGDPAWDIGSALGEYLGAWVLSIPALPGASLDEAHHLSRLPLDRLQPAMRVLWSEYVHRAHPSDTSAELLLAVQFAAAKLVQLGCEQMHRATELTPTAGALLQLAANMFADPPRAAEYLLGVEPAAAGAEEASAA